MVVFFFKQKTAYEMRISDWSSDVCSSDLRERSMSIHSSVLELIGDTPIVKARRLDAGACELYLKLENQNPGGSIKDRIGMSMIEAAEKRGDIKPGDTLVRSEEHTSELQSLMRIPYAVFCLKKKRKHT